MHVFKTINQVSELPPGTQVLNNSNKVINHEGHQYRIVGKKEQTLSLCERITRLMRSLLFLIGLAFRSAHKMWMQVWTGKETVYFGLLQKALSIESFPDELILNIFKFLSPGELGKASRVCKEWRRLASDQSLLDVHYLRTLYPGFNIIDEKVWEKHVDLKALGIDATGAPSLDKHTLMPIVRRLSEEVEGGAGVTLLTIPKGLTFDKLLQLAKNPKQGNAVPIVFRYSGNSQEFKDIPVYETYVVAITNSVLKESCNNPSNGVYYRHIHRYLEFVNNLGYKVPDILEATALIILTYMSSPKQPPVRLYPDNLYAYTYLLNSLAVGAVGGFYSSCLKIGGYNLFTDRCGIAAMQKFRL